MLTPTQLNSLGAHSHGCLAWQPVDLSLSTWPFSKCQTGRGVVIFTITNNVVMGIPFFIWQFLPLKKDSQMWNCWVWRSLSILVFMDEFLSTMESPWCLNTRVPSHSPQHKVFFFFPMLINWMGRNLVSCAHLHVLDYWWGWTLSNAQVIYISLLVGFSICLCPLPCCLGVSLFV